MALPQRPKHLGVHSTLLGLLLFVVANLSEFNLAEGCQPKRRYLVHLINETDTADAAMLNNSILTALNTEMAGKLCSSMIRIVNESDQPKGVAVAELELSANDSDGFETFEDLLLKGVNYNYENRTLTMMPYSRVFAARFNVSHPNVANDTYIEQVVKEALKEDPVIVTFIRNASEFKTFRLWLNISGSYYPIEALKHLIDAVENNEMKGLAVSKDSFKAYMVYPIPETRDFQVEFDYSLMECGKSMANASSQEYQSTKNDIEKMLNTYYKALQSFSNVEVSHLKCRSSGVRDASAFVRVTAVLKLQKSSMKTPHQIGEALQSCSTSKTNVSNLQVTLLTPQSFEDITETKITCQTSTTTEMPTTYKTQSKTTLPPSEPSTSPPSIGKTPRVFVRIRLALTWSQFCTKLEDSLKQNIAKNVYDKKGNVVSPDRVIFINSRKNCADPLKENELVDLWFYIAERSGTDKPSTCVTLKAQRVLRMMVNNGNTKMLGTDFAGKVISANLAGCDAKKIGNKNKDMDWTTLIIIAIVVGVVLLLLACCCICCGAARRRRRRRYKDKQMEMIIVDSAYVNTNGEGTGASSAEGKGDDQGKKGNVRGGKGAKHGHKGGGARGVYGGISDTDSGDYYDCCAGGFTGAHGGKKSKRDAKEKKKNKMDGSDGNISDANKGDANNADNKGNNNDTDAKRIEGNSNEGYEDLKLDKTTPDGQETSAPQSYQNLSYGLGDRKPSNSSQYATIADPIKRPSQDGDHQYENVIAGNQEQTQQGSPAISSAATGLHAGSVSDGNNRSGQTPAIITSPAPAENGTPTYDNAAGVSLGDRRASASKSASGTPVTSSRPSSGNSLNNVDDEQLRERRRSSIHSLVDDGAEPLKHKTATVGIVGLALRNKNERKKETEFKNLDKEMPALGTYPGSTAGKNRFPEILPNPRSRVKLSSSPDYINASYLHDHKGQRHYIATQHPLVETNDDFWQMVWDQDSHLIVMVNDDENSKQIDYPNYWPTTEGGSMEHNGFMVTNKQMVTKADYVITNLVITNTKVKPSASREITHYRFTSWKNKDQMPNVAMFVGFVVATREIGKKYEDGKNPVIVHCSDGQGFTGVFIALDIGIRSHEESKTSVVDLFELAKRLRQGRSGIINSLELYNFVYQCLYEYTVNYDEEAEKKKDA